MASKTPLQNLKDFVATRQGTLIIWVGSGGSAEHGLPTWGGLRNSLQDALLQKAVSADSDFKKQIEQRSQRIAKIANPWAAFEELRRNLGKTTFPRTIRDTLQASKRPPTPSLYNLLWQLKPAGILTLNLDRLVTKAHMEVFPRASALGMGN